MHELFNKNQCDEKLSENVKAISPPNRGYTYCILFCEYLDYSYVPLKQPICTLPVRLNLGAELRKH